MFVGSDAATRQNAAMERDLDFSAKIDFFVECQLAGDLAGTHRLRLDVLPKSTGLSADM